MVIEIHFQHRWVTPRRVSISNESDWRSIEENSVRIMVLKQFSGSVVDDTSSEW